MTAIFIPANVPASPAFKALHTVEKSWYRVMAQLAHEMAQRGVHPSRVVVLVPYAQLIQRARDAWCAYVATVGIQAAFTPRFETTMNWQKSLCAEATFLPAAAPTPDDMQLDAAVDALTAASLLERAGLGTLKHTLAGRLMEAAWSLSSVAAAIEPAQRLAWGLQLTQTLGVGLDSPALALELAIARIALVWAAASAYPSDVLFTAQADMLVALEGFQSEPLTDALVVGFGERALRLQLVPVLLVGLSTDGLTPSPSDAAVDILSNPACDSVGSTAAYQSPQTSAQILLGTLAGHSTLDAEDEAHRAAACVLAHLARGHSPVALIAQDRLLTRRIQALLAERGVALRDETGWKLSTTRAAAALMSLLRALAWDAPTDTVLDWLKNAPAFDAAAVSRAEVALRKAGVRFWRGLPKAQPDIGLIAAQAQPLRDGLQRTRSLAHWLADTRSALQRAGQWAALVRDTAGTAVLEALRLQDGGLEHPTLLPAAVRMSLADFTSWVSQTLEQGSFTPVHPPQARVVILPLSQLLGRPMQAVVMPGCDEVRLAASPEPPGLWTPTQRGLLGLASRAALVASHRAAWSYALGMPQVDLLWRTSERGERLMPSSFVQELLLGRCIALAADPRVARQHTALPTARPLPTGQALPVAHLSASAYEDLRSCPYRFFALRQLKVQDADELEGELGKRDFGNWLHTLLHHFHSALKMAPRQHLIDRVAMINIAAEYASKDLALSEAEFLPFYAIWPRVRTGYLTWLADHETTGAQFFEGEVWKNTPLGALSLTGKLDRIDHLPSGGCLVMDYKTESDTKTKQRINDSQEDTQLAFYAALLPDDTLAAAYVRLDEKGNTQTYNQPNIVELRDDLIASIHADMERIASGAALPALGDGSACDYCAVRGLCRKDFWS